MNEKISQQYIDPLFMKWLEQKYPEKTPDIKTSDRQIWFDAGQVSVVRHFRVLFDSQEETILAPENEQ